MIRTLNNGGLLYVQQNRACRLKNPHVWYSSVHEDAVTSHCSLSLVAVCFTLYRLSVVEEWL